jgi:hypothetical protein
VSDHLDDEKLEALGRWASSLQSDARTEVAAAGRAIAMLVDEVDRLQRLVRLTRAVDEMSAPEPEAAEAEPSEPEPEPEPERVLTPEQRSFRDRIASRSVFPLRSKTSSDPVADSER